MTGWAHAGGLGVIAVLCPWTGLSVDAQVEAAGAALSGHVDICRPDGPVAPAAEAGPEQVPGAAPRAAAPSRPGPPPAAPPPAPPGAAPRPAPADPPRATPRAAPRVRELLVPVRLEATRTHPRQQAPPPQPAPPAPPSYPAPAYRPPKDAERVGGRSVVTTTMVVTTPAVLAAALLRPRSRSAAGARSRPNSPSGGSS
ncbi:hypothetical protein [Streptomyces sp. NPDC052114]|uniref:hypothetical protein n=1 Tax=unclassified Streptomyces TaxID=2593676 RepID=UPI00343E95AD